jgi:hypothetical protein
MLADGQSERHQLFPRLFAACNGHRNASSGEFNPRGKTGQIPALHGFKHGWSWFDQDGRGREPAAALLVEDFGQPLPGVASRKRPLHRPPGGEVVP